VPWGCHCASSHQADVRKSQTGLNCRWELDSGMHGSEYGSGSQSGQEAASSSAAGHGGRKWHPCDPPALNWVWCVWHGIQHWSISGHLSCPSVPARMTLYNPSLAQQKRFINDLGCYSNNYKHVPFLYSIASIKP